MLSPEECRFSSVTPGKLPSPIPGWHIIVEMDPRTDPPNRSSEERQLLDSVQSKLPILYGFLLTILSARRFHAVGILTKCMDGKAIMSAFEAVTGFGSNLEVMLCYPQ